MLTLSLNLPWINGGHYRDDLRREEAQQAAAEFELKDYQAGLREEVHELTVMIDAARREALLYRDEIIPRSHRRWKAPRPRGSRARAASATCSTRAGCCSKGG